MFQRERRIIGMGIYLWLQKELSVFIGMIIITVGLALLFLGAYTNLDMSFVGTFLIIGGSLIMILLPHHKEKVYR